MGETKQQPFAPLGPPTSSSIGRLAPVVLLVWISVDVGLRFAPPTWLKLRPVLAAARFPQPHGPFEPNFSAYTNRFTGEAALEGNVPTTEQRPPVRFSTDELGFRINPAVDRKSRRPNVLVWRGASFTYGAALSDEETFPAQLAAITGLHVYNGGRFHLDPDGWPEFKWLLSQLAAKPETVVYLHLEQANLPGPPHRGSSRVPGFGVARVRESLAVRYAGRVARTWQRLSPLEIVSTRAFKAFSDDRILPNPYRHRLHEKKLPDGTTMLMRAYEVESAARVRDTSYVRSQADQFRALQEQLRSRGMNVIVVLVPTRQTVFSPWFNDSKGREQPASDYLRALERELAERRITTVNGLTVFRRNMDAEVANSDLSFYRDDNHWTPLGVRHIATAVAESLNPIPHSRSRQTARVLKADVLQ